jgi:hypothetical protein
MKPSYEQSAVYRQGCFHFELGLLLMDPKTTVTDIAEFATHYGLEADFVMRKITGDPPDPQQEQP